MDSRLAVLDQLPDLFTKLTEHGRRLNALEETQDLHAQRLNELECASNTNKIATQKTTNALTADSAELKRTINALVADKKMLSAQLLDISSHSRLTELTISGLTHVHSTDLIKLASCTVTALNVALEPSDIINVWRSGRRKMEDVSQEGSSVGNQREQLNLSDLTVKLKSVALVDLIIDAKSKAGGLHSSKLDRDLLRAANAPVPQKNVYINFNERLPLPLYNLLKAAKAKGKALGYKHVWCRAGQVRARYTDSSPTIFIRTEEDLSKITPMRTAVAEADVNEPHTFFRAQE